MNRNTLRWIITAIMALALAFTLSCPFIAEAEPGVLPLDFMEGGTPLKEENWTFQELTVKGKNVTKPLSYEDSTIRATFERSEITHKLVSGPLTGKTVTDEAWVVRIKIGHVSQLRTTVSRDTYKGKAQAPIIAMSKKKNAVVSMNGDSYKYWGDVGYLVRQGELIRDSTGNAQGLHFDMLLIDSEGDFHAIYTADTEKIDAYVAENLTPLGRTILDTFNFGPVLVADGEVQDIANSEVALRGDNQYEWSTPIHRIAIVQTGALEYAIVYTNGKGHRESGLTMAEFAEFIAEQCPGALLAYNLDGGGTANVAAHGEKLFTNSYLRDIYDVIYFASAEE